MSVTQGHKTDTKHITQAPKVVTSSHTTTMGGVYLINEDTKEYIDIGTLSQDFDVYKNISSVMITYVYRDIDISSTPFPSVAVHKLVTSVVGRWKLNDKYYIAFNTMIEIFDRDYKYIDYTLPFIKALTTVSMLNYGLTFTEPDFDNKVKEWFAYMNTEENKRKAKHPEDQTFELLCSLDDIWNPTYVIKDGKHTRNIPILKLASQLHKSFNEPQPVEPEQHVAVDDKVLLSSDKFIDFIQELFIYPAQLIPNPKYPQTGTKHVPMRIIPLHDAGSCSTQTFIAGREYDLTHAYFERHIHFEKDVLLRHANDPEHKFSLLRVKGETMELRTIVQIICEFVNSGLMELVTSNYHLYIKKNDDREFNMYEAASVEGKTLYDNIDNQGLVKIPFQVHEWIISNNTFSGS